MDELIYIVVTAIIAFVIGAYVSARIAVKKINEFSFPEHYTSLYLNVLRRELANILARRNPDDFLKMFKSVWTEAHTIPHLKEDRQRRMLTDLLSKYVEYESFDMIGTFDHVLYDDYLEETSEIESRYKDIVAFQAVQSSLNHKWKKYYPFEEKQMPLVEEYVRNLKDRIFYKRIMSAYHDWDIFYWAHKGEMSEYSTELFSVRTFYHYAENRYGIHLKDTNEYGLYSVFHADILLSKKRPILDISTRNKQSHHAAFTNLANSAARSVAAP
jgi:hypothetical protein